MQFLEDDVNLGTLTLPGTRHSCASTTNINDADVHIEPEDDKKLTKKLRKMHQHHHDSIPKQLKKGIRLLQLSCGKGNFISHGPLTIANSYLEDFIHQITEFLKENDSETVVVFLSWSSACIHEFDATKPWSEGGHSMVHDPVPERFDKYLKSILGDSDVFYTSTKEEWPTLGDVRGKAVILCGWEAKHQVDRCGRYHEPLSEKVSHDSTIMDTKQLVEETWNSITSKFDSFGVPQDIILGASLQHDPNNPNGWIVPCSTAPLLQQKARCYFEKHHEQLRGLWFYGDFMEEETNMAIARLNWYGTAEGDFCRPVMPKARTA
ncbi:1-phosphatidylinositol phosphodiesterase [Colletotrichum karsti]|uniref:1-phosphatidylinositol phosphodiesterase n=1 Tax=Colletotrichum karsti TaxID=1095194 RepID=A0A9P6IF83_9PEZI|nr:1-phosphatidylinositol phosphodiesterase [Colletotrichum karsti]KAF9880811.1 1-phosphatidylinositol phosphodiesterase [Colletotrichum karsti]